MVPLGARKDTGHAESDQSSAQHRRGPLGGGGGVIEGEEHPHGLKAEKMEGQPEQEHGHQQLYHHQGPNALGRRGKAQPQQQPADGRQQGGPGVDRPVKQGGVAQDDVLPAVGPAPVGSEEDEGDEESKQSAVWQQSLHALTPPIKERVVLINHNH